MHPIKEEYKKIEKFTNNFDKYANVKSVLMIKNSIWKPVISFVIPTYNRVDFLKDTIQSILKQMETIKYEIIVVDNSTNMSSENKTYQYIKSLKSDKISLYINSRNIGQAGNWNRAIELAKGKYVAMIHDDDLLEDNYLPNLKKCILNAYKRKKVIGMIIPTRKEFFEGEKILHDYTNKNVGGIREYKYWNSLIIDGIGPGGTPTCGTLYNKKAVIECGGFNENFFPSFDYVLGYQIMIKGYPIYYTEDVLGYYRIGIGETRNPEVFSNFIRADSFFRKELYKHNILGQIFGWAFGKSQEYCLAEGLIKYSHSLKINIRNQTLMEYGIKKPFFINYFFYKIIRKIYFCLWEKRIFYGKYELK